MGWGGVGNAVGQLLGVVALRLSDDKVLSFDYTNYATELEVWGSCIDVCVVLYVFVCVCMRKRDKNAKDSYTCEKYLWRCDVNRWKIRWDMYRISYIIYQISYTIYHIPYITYQISNHYARMAQLFWTTLHMYLPQNWSSRRKNTHDFIKNST